MAAEEYSRRLARVAVAQMAEMAGFTKAQQSAVDILSELLLKYVGELCSTAHSYAELANRTEFNVCDLSTALADMGSSFGDLKAYLDIYLAEQVSDLPISSNRAISQSHLTKCAVMQSIHTPKLCSAFLPSEPKATIQL